VLNDCGVTGATGPVATTALLAPPAGDALDVTTAHTGLCIGCTVSQPNNVIDTDNIPGSQNYAVMNTLVGLLNGELDLTVQNSSPFTGDHIAGFIVEANSGEVLTLDLIQNLGVTTLQGGKVQETASGAKSSLLRLDLLTLLGSNTQAFVGFNTVLPFDAVQLNVTNLIGAVDQVKVYRACVSP
jgi:hypothetical protein